MNTLFVAKSFGRYHYFKTEETRDAWVATLPEWEQKYTEKWISYFGKAVS